MQSLATERLILRHFCADDTEPFGAMNRDPEVMQHFPAPLSSEESAAVLQRFELHHREHGFGMLALELPGVAPYIGFVGLGVPAFDAPFTPCVEIAWRLSRAYWGRGLATDAARAVLKHAFVSLRLPEVVAFTAVENVRSARVMERLGMRYSGDFEHPRLPVGHRLRRHVLYRLPSSDFVT